jgi:NADH-quinone oxidoreductase subunit M
MLVVAIPWMKIQDTTNTPSISWNIASITQEIQKWATRNELAYHYVYECFPWMLLVLSVGFAIQAGLFPFHSTQIRVISNAQPEIAVLFLSGTLSASRIGWLRFVMPLAPDLMVSFDRWLLIPSIGGAVWGGLRALAPAESRYRPAYIYLSISGLLLLGCYCFTRIGMAGAWLMQQQLTVIVCSILLIIEDRRVSSFDTGQVNQTSRGMRLSTRALLLLAVFPILGFFASSFLIVAELLNDSLLLSATVFIIWALIFIVLKMVLEQHHRRETQIEPELNRKQRFPIWLLMMFSLTIPATVFPGWLIHQSEPEFARVFRRYEQTPSADFAEPASKERQSEP